MAKLISLVCSLDIVFNIRRGFRNKFAENAKSNFARLVSANMRRLQSSHEKYLVKDKATAAAAGERISSAHRALATERTVWKFANNFYRKVPIVRVQLNSQRIGFHYAHTVSAKTCFPM